MKLTIYTCVFGSKFTLDEPKYNNKNVRFICFTDQDIQSDSWEIIKKDTILTPRRQSRIYKILSHKYIDTEFSLYVDSKWIIMSKNPIKELKYFLKKKHLFVVSEHKRMGCVYKQTKFCISHGKADKEIAENQLKRFKNDGFPENTNGVNCTAILRRMSPEIEEFELAWWEEYMKGCQRDQTAFGYASWKNKFKYDLFDKKTFRKLFKKTKK